MKQKTNARQKREAEAQRRKAAFSPVSASTPTDTAEPAPRQPVFRPEVFPDQSPEEAARELLEYLDRHGTAAAKEGLPRQARKRKTPRDAIPRLNLEEGMPPVDEAVGRLRMGIQEMRAGGVKAVKLIHGYGSTGRGGKIRIGVRAELADMRRRKLIRGFIPGEEFGPADAASRDLADRLPAAVRDPDYGRINHGITIVVL